MFMNPEIFLSALCEKFKEMRTKPTCYGPQTAVRTRDLLIKCARKDVPPKEHCAALYANSEIFEPEWRRKKKKERERKSERRDKKREPEIFPPESQVKR